MNQIKHIIAVASGKGGVGKSTTSVNLALALKTLGASVGLLDADIYGPSQQMMLGIAPGTRPEQKDGQYLLPVEAHGLKTMSMGYLVDERTPMVWRGPMAGGALAQMLEQTFWGELDYLVIDMPPGTGDIQLTIVQTVALDIESAGFGRDPFSEAVEEVLTARGLSGEPLREHLARALSRYTADAESLLGHLVEMFETEQPMLRRLRARAVFSDLLTMMAQRGPLLLHGAGVRAYQGPRDGLLSPSETE